MFNKDIIVKLRNDLLLKFSHNDDLGINYETIINNNIKQKNILFKSSFKYFFINKSLNKSINLICQNELGNIVLCKFINNKWIYRNLVIINNTDIMPINIKAFFYKDKIKFLFNIGSKSEKIYETDNFQDIKTVYYDKNDINVEFDILSFRNNNILLIESNAFNIYKILVKVFDKEKWGREKIIYISNEKYIDKSYCIIKDKIKFLILEKEKNIKSIIYKNIDTNKNELSKDVILFEHIDISSCLITVINSVMWAVWISENRLYGSYSIDLGENFSSPLVYKNLENEDVRKIKFIEGNKSREVYFYEEDGKIKLFLEDILKVNEVKFNINYKSISCGLDIKDEKIIDNDKIKKSKEFEDKQRKYTINY